MIVLVTIFVLAYFAIAFEHQLGIDKSIPAVLGAGLMWAYISTGIPLVKGLTAEESLMHHIPEISGILFFLIGAMTIVNVLEKRGSLSLIQRWIRTDNQIKIMWIVTGITFFLSAVLDNLTTTIVMIAIMQKVVRERRDLLVIAVIIIIAANAGGAWSPIGDVTTTMLWVSHKITTGPLIKHTFLPSIVQAVFIPILFTIFPSLLSKMTKGVVELKPEKQEQESIVDHEGKVVMLIMGIGALISVPIFKQLTHLPPFIGMLIGASVVVVINEYYNRRAKEHHITYHHLLQKVEWNAILFFLGILMAVGAFQSVAVDGQSSLIYASNGLRGIVNDEVLGTLFGIFSAIIDNVPLVAAAQGMFDFPQDHWFWTYLAYSAGTGGSILIIGSAAGVVAQTMLKIDFMWYMKKFSLLILLSFLAGAGTFFLQMKLF